MSKFTPYIILVSVIISYNISQNTIVNQSVESDTSSLASNSIKDTIPEISGEEFSKQLEAHKITNLPYEIKSRIRLPNHKWEDSSDYEMIWPISFKRETSLTSLDKYYKFKDINGLDKVNNTYSSNENEIDSNWNLILLERFEPNNDSIEVLLLSSNCLSSGFVIWIIATYDMKNMEKIDNAIIGVFEIPGDMYEESYFKIKGNYSINCIFSTHYESNPDYVETDYQIKPNGKIEKVLTQYYSYDIGYDEEGDNLLSYSNSVDGYYVEFFLGELANFSEDEVKECDYPNCMLSYKKNGIIDSSFILTKPIVLYDNQNRKWLHIYSYKTIDFEYSKSNV
ncbi:MAG: hypothetical protein K9J13_02285, partial [Saprospiraceae bacterium]|nr:hypothetical protein [Saprospiraceae bacterium]